MWQVNETIEFKIITRKHLAYRADDLQYLDDRVTGRIKYLKLTPWSVTIDKTSFTYDTISQPRQGVPLDMNMDNEEELGKELIEGRHFEDRRIEFRQRIIDDVLADNNGVVEYGTHLERRIVHCSAAGEEPRYVHIHRDGQMRNMLRRQIQKLFGQNRIHQVEHLHIGIDYGISRLPRGLVFKVKELTCLENSKSAINSILPIVHNSSLPFHNLSVKLQSKWDSVLNNQVLTQAEHLVIHMPYALFGSWAQTIIALPNRIIHLENNDIPLQDVVVIAENWIENFKDVGTKLSMVSLDSAEFAMDAFQARVEATRKLLSSRQCHCASRHLTAHSELVVYGYENPNFEEELQDEEEGNPWIIVMEILPIGSSVDLIN